ncbi:hypothetical protein L291_4205 [Acinetobacter guillouiae MSP4-18]|nr:hypothetical protein L291_4205 [Acinetobacter guillouiae MSP4-18]
MLKYTYNYAQQLEQDYQHLCKSYAEYHTEHNTVIGTALHKPE